MAYVHAFALAFLCLALPLLGSAAELRVSASSAISYDSVNEGSDGRASILFSAPIEVRTSSNDRYQGRIRYQPLFEVQPTSEFRNNWNHLLSGDGTYELSRRSRLGATLLFADQGFVTASTSTAPDGTIDPAARFKRITAALRYNYLLSRRWTLNSSLIYDAAKFDDDFRNDSQTATGSLNFAYLLGRKDDVAFGIDASFSAFDPSVQSQGQDVTNLRLFLSWTHRFTKDLVLQVNGGPTLSLFETLPFPDILQAQFPTSFTPGVRFVKVNANCPAGVSFLVNCQNADAANIVPDVPGPGTFSPLGLTVDEASASVVPVPVPSLSSTDRQVNYFGTVGLSYTHLRWRFNVDYRRTQSTQSGFGTSTALDAVGAAIDWTATDRWTVRLVGRVSQRKSLTESFRPVCDAFLNCDVLAQTSVPDGDGDPVAETAAINTLFVSRPVNRREAFVRLYASRRMTTRLHLTGSALYSYTERRVDLPSALDELNKNNRFRIEFGVLYSFRPIRL